jgi:hypothetical protein
LNHFFQDIDITGKEKRQGIALEYFDADAIKNALYLFVTSKRGDFLRNPYAGGLIDFQTFKTMSEVNIQKASFAMRNAINNNFAPSVEIQSINMVPDYTNHILEYQIIYRDTITLNINSVSVYTDTTFEHQKFQYTDIAYTGENLYKFIILQKTNDLSKRLIYDADDGHWFYGKFKFINFSQSDPLFDSILALANT